MCIKFCGVFELALRGRDETLTSENPVIFKLFSRSPKRTLILDEIVKRRLSHSASTSLVFDSRTVNTLFKHQDYLKHCLDKIIDEDGMDLVTISETYMRGIDGAQLNKDIKQFQQQIIRIRNVTDNDNQERNNEEPVIKRQKLTDEDKRPVIAKEVCDTILTQISDRFEFRDHLSAAKLFDSQNCKAYRNEFPQKYLDKTVKSYPMLDSAKLKSGIFSFLLFVTDNNLKKFLTETYKLLDIICTTLMSTVGRERCFSTLKRIKSFLKSTMSDQLNALAVLSIEKKFVQSIPDFNNKVIDIFSSRKNRRMNFMYKKKAFWYFLFLIVYSLK